MFKTGPVVELWCRVPSGLELECAVIRNKTNEKEECYCEAGDWAKDGR